MPNIKGPWFTPVLYGITDEAKKLGYDVDHPGCRRLRQRRQAGHAVLQPDRAEGQGDPARPGQSGIVQRRGAAGEGRPRSRSSASAARSSPARSRPTPPRRPAIAASAMSWPRARRPCCRTAARSPSSPGRPARSGPPTVCAASRRTSPAATIKIVAEQTSEQDAAVALVARQRLPAALSQRRPAVRRRRHLRRGAARAAQGAQKCGKVKIAVRRARRGRRGDDAARLRRLRRRAAAGPDRPHRGAAWPTSSSRAQPLDEEARWKSRSSRSPRRISIPSTRRRMQAPKGWTP